MSLIGLSLDVLTSVIRGHRATTFNKRKHCRPPAFEPCLDDGRNERKAGLTTADPTIAGQFDKLCVVQVPRTVAIPNTMTAMLTPSLWQIKCPSVMPVTSASSLESGRVVSQNLK